MAEMPPAERRRRRTGQLRRLARDRRAWISMPLMVLFVLAAIWPSWFDLGGPGPCLLQQSLDPPSLAHPFGFDVQGCDLFARTVHGTRNSLLVGFGAVGLASLLALVVGAVAGMFRGLFDAVVGGAIDLLTGIPVVLVGLVLLTATDQRGVVHVTLVLVLFAWPLLTKVVRAEVMRVSSREYVVASHALGAGRWRTLRRHVVPNSTGPLLAVAVLTIATLITTEAILTFVGAGLQLPDVSWGVLVAEARERLAQAPHLALPGVFLVAAAGALTMLGDAVRDLGPPQ